MTWLYQTQPIDDLPNTLEKIFLGKSFDFSVNNLPISLIELTIKSDYQRNDIFRLPKNIQKITFINYESYHEKLDIFTIDNQILYFSSQIITSSLLTKEQFDEKKDETKKLSYENYKNNHIFFLN